MFLHEGRSREQKYVQTGKVVTRGYEDSLKLPVTETRLGRTMENRYMLSPSVILGLVHLLGEDPGNTNLNNLQNLKLLSCVCVWCMCMHVLACMDAHVARVYMHVCACCLAVHFRSLPWLLSPLFTEAESLSSVLSLQYCWSTQPACSGILCLGLQRLQLEVDHPAPLTIM